MKEIHTDLIGAFLIILGSAIAIYTEANAIGCFLMGAGIAKIGWRAKK